MKSKVLTTGFLALLLVAIVSAAFTVSPTTVIFNPGDNSQTVSVTNTGSSNISITTSTLEIVGEGGETVSFDITGDTTNIAPSTSITLTISPTSSIDFSNFDFGETYSSSFTINDGSENREVNVRIENDNVCEVDDQGSLRVRIASVDNVRGYGDDDKWYPFDEIEIEVDVENTNNNEDIDNIEVEWGIYDHSNNEWIRDLDEADELDLKDDEEETITISFKVDADDLDVDLSDLSGGDFTIYVRATGEEQEDPEFDVCASDSESIEIVTDDTFVIVSDLNLPEQLSCGETVQATAELWNIEDNEQEDVTLFVRNQELGINEQVEVGDIDELDRERVTFNLEIPENVDDGTYNLIVEVYDEDNDLFENEEDDESRFVFPLILNNCNGASSDSDVSISAELVNAYAVAGEEMQVRVTLRNLGDETTDFRILVSDYDSWASLEGIDKDSLSLDADESGNVLITLVPEKDVDGDREFKIQVLYDGKLNEQRINVPVEPQESPFSGFDFNLGENIRENWVIWVIGALNVILVILIIVVAVRIARR